VFDTAIQSVVLATLLQMPLPHTPQFTCVVVEVVVVDDGQQ